MSSRTDQRGQPIVCSADEQVDFRLMLARPLTRDDAEHFVTVLAQLAGEDAIFLLRPHQLRLRRWRKHAVPLKAENEDGKKLIRKSIMVKKREKEIIRDSRPFLPFLSLFQSSVIVARHA